MPKVACIVSDLHGHERTLKYIGNVSKGKCDYILVAGDITSADSGASPDPVFQYLNKIGIPIVAVLGNSDRLEFIEEYSNLENLRLLHFDWDIIDSIKIIGVSGIQRQNHGSNYFLTEAQFYHGLVKVYEDAGKPTDFILMSHAPPYGFGDITFDGEHIGSKGLRKFDEIYSPKIHICGHVHEDSGTFNLGKTLIINPGIQRPDQPILFLNLNNFKVGYIP